MHKCTTHTLTYVRACVYVFVCVYVYVYVCVCVFMRVYVCVCVCNVYVCVEGFWQIWSHNYMFYCLQP